MIGIDPPFRIGGNPGAFFEPSDIHGFFERLAEARFEVKYPMSPGSMAVLPIVSTTTSVAPGIWRWSAFSPHHRVDLASHLVWDGWNCLVFDPLPLADPLWATWPLEQKPGWLVLTNENHERDVKAWSERFSDAVCMGLAGERKENRLPSIPSNWVCFDLAGGAGGEAAFHCAALDLMVFGDAVVNLPGRGLELLPEKYCRNPAQLRHSLGLLPRFGRALLAHGEPLMERASERIHAVVGS